MTELAVGQTIRLSDGRTAVIRFIGQTLFAAGDWVGVELDDDRGKNDGSVQGERYFDCAMGHGMFVRPTTVTVLAQPPPPPAAAAAAPAPAPAPAPTAPPSRPPTAGPTRKAGRPSSMFTTGTTGRGTADPGLPKRMSLNAPSPSPVPRGSRPSSIGRSPTKSPTKQLGTAASSASNSRTATPSNARGPPAVKPPRPSSGSMRTSMGPPPVPGSRTVRQSSISSATASRVGAGSGAPPSRSMSGRFALGGGPRPAGRLAGMRVASIDSQSGGEGAGARGRGTIDGRIASSPQKSDEEILSPHPTSPAQARTAAALEKHAAASKAADSARSVSGSQRPPAANAAAASREIEDLKAKLRVMERKRLEDRDKIKQLDKIQGERDKFESIIQKIQTKYQPLQQENNDLRRQLKEAEARLESVEVMQAEHESTLELATLDREMAEETAEVYKAELEALKGKLEELELEVDVLREENAEVTKGMTPQEKASAGWLQMERSNERLKEALIRLRDITQQQEEELKDQIKGLEEELRELGEVKEQYDAAREKLAQTESAVEDLRQQLDNALGAEDMIEDLTERNMSQAEQIEELKAVIEDLENLKEINDELEINHVQNEKEMQEEIDFKEAVIAEQARRAAQQEEALEDMEYTLSRFRELVTSLQTDLEDMRASHAVTENESEQLNSKSRAMMDLNMKLQISAAKAQVKTIDLELRRMEAQEAEQHLEIVKLFLPESYRADRDSVLALLRFRRLAFKANLLNGFVKERVNGQPQPGHEDDVFAGCDAVDKLTWVAAMCDRFVNAISHCSMEQFARFEGALYELEPVERALNAWIDGLRRDELKEQQCAEELQRTIALMTHLGELHIPANDLESFADDVHMKALLMQSHLESAAATFHTARGMVQRVIPPAGDEDELAQYFARKAEAVITQTRSAKVIAGKAVRALEELKMRSLSLTPDTLEAFEQCEAGTQELAELARRIGRDLHGLVHEEGRAEPYTYVEVQACAQKAAALATSGPSETDLFATYMAKLRAVTGQITDLAALSSDLSQTQEFDRPQAPWLLRSQELRAQKTIPVDAEEELRRLREDYNEARRAIAQREESLGTAQLKIETLESRMRDANAKAGRMAELEALVERERAAAAGLKEDVEKQDRELKSLEADRDKWKKIASDASLLAGAGADGTGSDGGPGGKGGAANQERAVATAREMDALRAEIASLQAAVRFLREDSRRARAAEQSRHAWLAEPLRRREPPPAERRRALVAAEARDALGELLKMASSATVFDLSAEGERDRDLLAWRPARSTPQYHAARQAEDLAAWRGWHDAIARKAHALSGTGRGGGGGGRHQHGDQDRDAAAARKRALRNAANRPQVRLPEGDADADGGGEKSLRRGGTGGGEGEGAVRIVGAGTARWWEEQVKV